MKNILCLGLLFSLGCASRVQIPATPPANPSAATFNVRAYGAVGDGHTPDTAAVQAALDACAVAGGGTVEVPAGNYLIGSVQLGNRTLLQLDPDSTLLGSSNLTDYPLMSVRWEGRWQLGHRALIYADNVDHTGIVGPGTIAGNSTVAAPQNPRGAVVLEPISCQDVRWEGFTVTQGGNWATHPTYCTDVRIKDVTIRGKRDGIDVDSCQHVRIEHCDINTGDDSISLKSGRGLNGARIGKPTADVVITNCVLVDHGFACVGIGSETSGGIRDVRMDHCQMTSRSVGIFIKSKIGRSGVLENIEASDIDVLGGGFLRINLISIGNSNTTDDSVPGPAGYPVGRNFHFSDIRLHNATLLTEAYKFDPERPLTGFSLENVTGTCQRGIRLGNIRQAELRNIHVTGYKGELLTQTNLPDLIVDRVP